MTFIGFGVDIIGVQQSRDTLGRFSSKMTSGRVAVAMRDPALQSVERMRAAMKGTWSSGEGSGRLADSLGVDITSDESGNARIEFTIGAFRELEFVSAIGTAYQPGPYEIVAHGKTLRFFWKQQGRMAYPQRVMHPGFPYDVIVDTAQQEASVLAEVAEDEFYSIIVETFGS